MNKFKLYIIDLEPAIGAEMKKTRPCLIVSPDEMNNCLQTVIIVPLTSQSRELPTRVAIKSTPQSGLANDSYAALDQIKTVSKTRLTHCIGEIAEPEKHAISETLKEMFDY